MKIYSSKRRGRHAKTTKSSTAQMCSYTGDETKTRNDSYRSRYGGRGVCGSDRKEKWAWSLFNNGPVCHATGGRNECFKHSLTSGSRSAYLRRTKTIGNRAAS